MIRSYYYGIVGGLLVALYLVLFHPIDNPNLAMSFLYGVGLGLFCSTVGGAIGITVHDWRMRNRQRRDRRL